MGEQYVAAALRGIYLCQTCGTLVGNDDRHDDWHRGDIDPRFHAETAQEYLAAAGFQIPLNDVREAIDAALGIDDD